MIKDLFSYNRHIKYQNLTNYKSIMIYKVAIKVIISFITNRFAGKKKKFQFILP